MVLAVSPSRAPRVMDALWSLMVPTRLEPGCLLCTAWSEPDSTVHYLEEWATEPDMQRARTVRCVYIGAGHRRSG